MRPLHTSGNKRVKTLITPEQTSGICSFFFHLRALKEIGKSLSAGSMMMRSFDRSFGTILRIESAKSPWGSITQTPRPDSMSEQIIF